MLCEITSYEVQYITLQKADDLKFHINYPNTSILKGILLYRIVKNK